MAHRFKARFLARGDTLASAGAELKRHPTTIRNWLFPADDIRARRPRRHDWAEIEALSGGDLTRDNFDDEVELIIATPDEARTFREMLARRAELPA